MKKTLTFLALLCLLPLALGQVIPMEKDYEYEITEGDFNKTKVEIFDIKTPVAIAIETDLVDSQTHKKFFTPVVSIESTVEFKTAKITLPIKGPVETIFKCSLFDPVKFKCLEDWESTDIPFTLNYIEVDDGNKVGDTVLVSTGTISFEVESFSAYGGGKIVIIKAEHLDENREFVSDIYGEVREKDNNWSEPIEASHYVRVRFEKPLTKENDITVFARSAGGSIEIYRQDGNVAVAEINGIAEAGWYSTFLDSLGEEEAADFDLRVLGNSIEFDYIVDPTYDDYEDETLDRWTSATNGGGSAANSALAAKNGSRGVRFTGDGDNDTKYYRLYNTEENAASGNYWTWIRTSDASEAGCSFMLLSQTNAYVLGHMRNWNGTLQTYAGAVNNNFTATLSDNTWYRFRINYDNGTDLVSFYLYDASNTFIESILDVTPTDNEDAGETRMTIWDIHSSSVTTDFDDTSFTSTSEPVSNVAPDVNLSTIESLSLFGALPYFSYVADGNLTVAFNVFDSDNDRLTLDINLSTGIAIDFPGTVLYKDLNLTSDICTDQDWDDVASSCSIDINSSLHADANWYIHILLSDGTDTDTNVSGETFNIDNTSPTSVAFNPSVNATSLYNTVFFDHQVSDNNSGVKGCWFARYFNGNRDVNGFIDVNSGGYCHQTYDWLVAEGTEVYLRFYAVTDHADNNLYQIVDTGVIKRLFVQEVDPEGISDEDIVAGLNYLVFSGFKAIAGAVLLLIFLAFAGVTIVLILKFVL